MSTITVLILDTNNHNIYQAESCSSHLEDVWKMVEDGFRQILGDEYDDFVATCAVPYIVTDLGITLSKTAELWLNGKGFLLDGQCDRRIRYG